MIASTYTFNNLDEKWLNMLFCLWVTTDKICSDTYSKEEFIKNPLYRIQIPSLTQIIYKILNTNEDDIKFNYLVLEEIIRRKSDNNLKNIENLILEDIIINLSNGIKPYNKYLIGVNLFKQFKYMKEDFLKNNCVLPNQFIIILKNHISEHRKYFIDQGYYSFDKINELYNTSFSENQIKALVLQCIIQERDKNRLNAIKNNKYYDPFTDSEKCIESCMKYIDNYNNYKKTDQLDKELSHDLDPMYI